DKEDRGRDEAVVAAHGGADPAQHREQEVDRSGDASPVRVGEEVRPLVLRDVEILGEVVGAVGLGDVVAHAATVAQALRSFASVAESGSGRTRVSAIAVMKFVSAFQRGTTCTWRWPGTPAPAAAPRLIPTFTPSGAYASFTAAVARCVRCMSAAASSAGSASRSPSWRKGATITWPL